MISYEIYKIMHIFGFVLLFMGLSGTLFAFASASTVPPRIKILGFASHGLGLLLVLTGGFGMLARMGIIHSGLPGWIHAKLAIWVALGIAISISKRKGQWAPALVALYAVMVAAAGYLAIFKPF